MLCSFLARMLPLAGAMYLDHYVLFGAVLISTTVAAAQYTVFAQYLPVAGHVGAKDLSL